MEVSLRGEDSASAALLTPSDRQYDAFFKNFGLPVGEGGLPVGITIDSGMESEEYALIVQKDAITLTAGVSGLYYAFSTLSQLCCDGRIAAAEISDKPAVPLRGVIEGFFGQSWSHEFRLKLLETMGAYKMNTYIYAPKDDPKHRAQWWSAYTPKELKKMRALVECAAANNVRFVFAISPGLDIRLGDGYDKDLVKLYNKCESLYGIGVRDFAIFLDDIDSRDAEGHAKLLNDFQRDFIGTHEGCSDLLTVLPEYSDVMLSSYTGKIAPLLAPEISVMWTGSSTTPASITEKSLKKINEKLGRKVYIWWNYPVNDTMPERLFMGPCENLDPNLGSSISGFVSNPMNQGYASLLPLLTIADYLWNPTAYDADRSQKNAARILAPGCADGLLAFADLTRASLINGEKSSLELSQEVKAFEKGTAGSAEILLEKLEKISAALAGLREKADGALIGEIGPWLDKAECYVAAAAALVRIETAADESQKAAFALYYAAHFADADFNGAVVSADVLVPLLESAKTRVNAVLGDAADTSGGKTVSTNMPVYQNYKPEYAVDGQASTIFWSSEAPRANSTFTIDLGKACTIVSVRLSMGDDAHKSDYVQNGVIEYSVDGKEYVKLCDAKSREVFSETEIYARYVRVRCLASQTNWVIISDFDVKRTATLPQGAAFDGDDVDFSALTDGDLFTVFLPDPAAVDGKTLTFDLTGKTRAALYLTETAGLSVCVVASDGTTFEMLALTPLTVIGTDGAAALVLRFSAEPAGIAEIVII